MFVSLTVWGHVTWLMLDILTWSRHVCTFAWRIARTITRCLGYRWIGWRRIQMNFTSYNLCLRTVFASICCEPKAPIGDFDIWWSWYLLNSQSIIVTRPSRIKWMNRVSSSISVCIGNLTFCYSEWKMIQTRNLTDLIAGHHEVQKLWIDYKYNKNEALTLRQHHLCYVKAWKSLCSFRQILRHLLASCTSKKIHAFG